VVRETNTQCI